MAASGIASVETVDVKSKRVLVRVDINAPIADGRVTDDTRLRAIVPTVRLLLERGARPTLLAHLGRPKGTVVPELSLEVLRAPLEELLGAPVVFAGGGDAFSAPDAPDGAVVLMENVRFHPGEEKNDAAFADALAALGDVYVNDAFSCAHRAHASTHGLAERLPAYAGLQMMAELDALARALEEPERPVAAIVGGAKVSTKIALLENLASRVDVLVIGGGMANTFLKRDGLEIGTSLHEADEMATIDRIRSAAAANNCRLILPVDVVGADAFSADAAHDTYAADALPADRMILDVGPRTVETARDALAGCKTVLWNGPLGAFEMAPFAAGTQALAVTVAELTRAGRIVSVAGGGDTVAALNSANVAGDMTYLSTAGGAFLEWLEGRTLPGVAALRQANAN